MISFSCVTLKFDRWPWKTIGHLFYATSSFVHHFKAIGKSKLKLQSENGKVGSKSAIVFPCDLEIWQKLHSSSVAEREREIKFIGLFENRGHRGPYSPYKPFNHNLYIGIIIFPHIDNPQYTGYDLPKKKPNKIINAKKVRAPLIWQIIGEKDSGSVYMWI